MKTRRNKINYVSESTDTRSVNKKRGLSGKRSSCGGSRVQQRVSPRTAMSEVSALTAAHLYLGLRGSVSHGRAVR